MKPRVYLIALKGNGHEMGIKQRREEEIRIRKNDIIDAAERVFFGKGYEHSTMDDIAREAEFTKKTLYSYFSSKEELYLEIMIRGFRYLNGMFDNALAGCAGKSELDKMRAMGIVFVEFGAKYPGHLKAIDDYENRESDFTKGKNNEHIKECYSQGQYSHELLRGCVERGMKNGELSFQTDPDTASIFMWSCLQGFLRVVSKKSEYFRACFSKDAGEIIQFGLDTLIDSLRAGGKERDIKDDSKNGVADSGVLHEK